MCVCETGQLLRWPGIVENLRPAALHQQYQLKRRTFVFSVLLNGPAFKKTVWIKERGAVECVLIPWLSDHLRHRLAVWLCRHLHISLVASLLAEVPARTILSLCFHATITSSKWPLIKCRVALNQEECLGCFTRLKLLLAIH